ncbi:MAG: hypothetical protein KAT65_20920, partial [Methanophagales archaeon]|nr:hypothetical protein [Methanophagales archaeon]
PSWKYALNYETEWMNRDEIVDCTYQAGLKLNRLKVKYGLMDEESCRAMEKKINLAIELTNAIDEIIEIKDERVKHEKLLDLKPKSDMILDSVISEKREMVWPAEKKRFGVLHLLKLAIIDCLKRQ